ncbi:hypothetical protein [Deefgea rivuli]|uniref:hypothetical protein n=1 Tax=Deefgea rivuli TaxID=400948 RepID=UPI0012EC0310|nr:hypothetical protein [Deefgea rivuli]
MLKVVGLLLSNAVTLIGIAIWLYIVWALFATGSGAAWIMLLSVPLAFGYGLRQSLKKK